MLTEEAYTSRASALDNDPLPQYVQGERPPAFSGRRIHRGLYKSRNGKLLNADVNGSMNIVRKVIPDVYDQGIGGLPCSPVMVNPLRTSRIV